MIDIWPSIGLALISFALSKTILRDVYKRQVYNSGPAINSSTPSNADRIFLRVIRHNLFRVAPVSYTHLAEAERVKKLTPEEKAKEEQEKKDSEIADLRSQLLQKELKVCISDSGRWTAVADMKQSHEFAVKWFDKFRNKKINYLELVDHYMACLLYTSRCV